MYYNSIQGENRHRNMRREYETMVVKAEKTLGDSLNTNYHVVSQYSNTRSQGLSSIEGSAQLVNDVGLDEKIFQVDQSAVLEKFQSFISLRL